MAIFMDGSLAKILGERHFLWPAIFAQRRRFSLIDDVILDGRQPAHLTLKDLMGPFPVKWAAQKSYLLIDSSVE